MLLLLNLIIIIIHNLSATSAKEFETVCSRHDNDNLLYTLVVGIYTGAAQ